MDIADELPSDLESVQNDEISHIEEDNNSSIDPF